MSDFTRQPVRYDVPSLRVVQERQELRDEALRRFVAEERRLSNRVTRVIKGVRGAAKDTVRVAWQWWAFVV